MQTCKLSLVIPCKNRNDPKLEELLRSIEAQDFPKGEMEVLVITEGTSESAKAIGIRRAKGEVIGILASDNVLPTNYPFFLQHMHMAAKREGATHPAFYELRKCDDFLTRYFALLGSNDPLAFYMNKHDRFPRWHVEIPRYTNGRTIGDNGFFIERIKILETDLDNYYHIDNANEAPAMSVPEMTQIVHNTGGNIFFFFRKRYCYGLQHAFNKNRRWKLVDFYKPIDIWRLIWFIFVTLTVVQPLYLSMRGYSKVRDVAWFLHWPVCVMTVFMYALLITHLGLLRLSQSLFAPTVAQKA